MKSRLHIFCFLLFPATASLAQNSIFAGKIVDGRNIPIHGATIRVSKNTNATEARSDVDGLFYTRLLQSNTYNIDAIVDGNYHSAKRIHLPPQNKTKVFYLLKIVDNKLLVRADGVDPFMKAKLSKADEEQPIFDIFHGKNTTFYISIKDSASDKLIRVYGGYETAPSMR